MSSKGAPCYEIRVRGRLDARWSEWFEGLALTSLENGETLIASLIQDQAALLGIPAKIRSLGMELVSVVCVDCEDE